MTTPGGKDIGSPRNRFDRMEWAGAFGDLGTLIPFAVAYITVLKMDPFGVLFAFGAAMLACGLYYKTPFPVQPMKAIGATAATQAAQTAVISQATVLSAGLVTGCALADPGPHRCGDHAGQTGVPPHRRRHRPGSRSRLHAGGHSDDELRVDRRRARSRRHTAAPDESRHPGHVVLLVFGAVCGAIQDPTAAHALLAIHLVFRTPSFAFSALTWHDLMIGTLFLALPQMPLTLGNAVIAISEENNRLFPALPVTEKSVAISTGIMNIAGAALGGVPMCHGAGGMAGHVAFGARTGGAPIILGTLLLLLAFFLSGSIDALFNIFPRAVLGVVLFITGAQLALGSCDFSKNKAERFITLVTAAFSMWNVGLAFVVGLLLTFIARRGLLRL